MRTYKLEREQIIKKPLKEVFEFFSHPENLAKITPDKLDFNILTPTPIEMKPGALVDYTVKPMLFPIRWTTLITDYDPPFMFIDQQLKGPYSFWHHKHTFEDTPDGTLIKDEVVYALPFGLLGDIAYSLFVKKQLSKIFDYRAKVIKDYFESSNNNAEVVD